METAMKRTPKISEAEWEVMKVLWKRSPRTANDIVEELTGKTPWKRETIRTLINRLAGKKVIKFEKKGRQYHYAPRVTEAECLRAESDSFFRRFGPSSVEPMLAAFVQGGHLSAEKIAGLKRLLEEKDASGEQNQQAEQTP
jgi:BlaI family penicillinase repressor